MNSSLVLLAWYRSFNVVKTLKAQSMTIFLVEQKAFAALAIADRGYVLETGHITLTGTGQELISNEQVRAASRSPSRHPLQFMPQSFR